MASLNSSYIHDKITTLRSNDSSNIYKQKDQKTYCSTPNNQKTYCSAPNNQTKMVDFLASTLKSITSHLCSNKNHKSLKTRISILPLTRTKIKSGQKSRKKIQKKVSFEGLQTISVCHQPFPNRQIRGTKVDNICKQNYVQFFSMMSFMNNKLHKKSFKLQVMIDQLGQYFNKHKQRQYSRDILEIVAVSGQIRSSVINGQAQIKYETIKQCEGDFSKLFFNICYQIYLYKQNKFSLGLLAIIHRDVEYYSRRMGLLGLTTLCCMDMGRVFCDYFQFQKASQEYSKAIKLAVYVGDKYSEQVAIDRLGLCDYYKGDMISANFYHNNVDRLSSYQKLKIKEHYSNEKQIQKILQQKTKQRSIEDQIKQVFFRHNKQNVQFNFENMVKDSELTQKNYDVFRNNVKEMIKINSLRKKVPLIKRALGKIDRIGQKTFCCKDNQVLKPSIYHSKTSGRCQQEFLMSHRSFNRNNVPYESMKIDKHCKMIDQILNFFTSDLKTTKAIDIKEERQSYMSEQSTN